MKLKTTFRKALIASVPVMTGYIVLGIAFGILFHDKGYSWIWAFAMSLLVYAGSMQFVLINLITGGASLLSCAMMTLFVNARHLFYGVSMLKQYSGTGKMKPYLIFSLTDETYALVLGNPPEDVDPNLYRFFISAMDQSYWVLGSVLGGLIGSALTIDTTGIDFAMTALFVTIFTEQILTAKDHISAVIGVVSSVLCLFVFGPSRFLIPSMVMIGILLGIYGSRKAPETGKEEN